MVLWWDDLEVNSFAAEKTFEHGGTFIVIYLHFYFNPRAARLLCSVLYTLTSEVSFRL